MCKLSHVSQPEHCSLGTGNEKKHSRSETKVGCGLAVMQPRGEKGRRVHNRGVLRAPLASLESEALGHNVIVTMRRAQHGTTK